MKSTPVAVRSALRTSRRLAENLSHIWPFYLLKSSGSPSGEETIVQSRLRRVNEARRLWPQAVYYGNLIARLPFVRMVAVTGALAMDNVERGADIDYLIVTSQGRLWLCRGLVVLLVKWASLRGVTICPNYLLTERALVFPDQSLYAAHELVQMVPLHGLALYRQIRRVNRWTEQLLPNAGDQPYHSFLGTGEEKGGAERPFRFKLFAERALSTPPGDWLERWEMQRKIRKFTRRHPASPEIDFCADWCKGHFDLHGEKTLDSYTQRLARFGLAEQLIYK
jgi:hypothetical protein